MQPQPSKSAWRPGHGRWHSVDASELRKGGSAIHSQRMSFEDVRPLLKGKKALVSDPKVAADVARIFDKMVS